MATEDQLSDLRGSFGHVLKLGTGLTVQKIIQKIQKHNSRDDCDWISCLPLL